MESIISAITHKNNKKHEDDKNEKPDKDILTSSSVETTQAGKKEDKDGKENDIKLTGKEDSFSKDEMKDHSNYVKTIPISMETPDEKEEQEIWNFVEHEFEETLGPFDNF